jgi:glycosyltransferase involved in cell wall biosynthesis
LLASRWWRGPVTVYGEWPDQPDNVIPFFTSLLSTSQIERAHRSAARAWTQQEAWTGPLRILFTGRLTRSKNVDVLLRAIGRCREEGLDVEATVLGEGPEESNLKQLAVELKIDSSVRFLGGVPFDEVLQHLEQSHALVLASKTEGWPKSIAEAMAFGLVAIGSNRGLVPTMLGDGRGLLVEPGDVPALTRHLTDIVRRPGHYAGVRQAAAAWSQRFSLDGLQTAIEELLEREWNLSAQEESVLATSPGGVK